MAEHHSGERREYLAIAKRCEKAIESLQDQLEQAERQRDDYRMAMHNERRRADAAEATLSQLGITVKP